MMTSLSWYWNWGTVTVLKKLEMSLWMLVLKLEPARLLITDRTSPGDTLPGDLKTLQRIRVRSTI